MIFLILALNFGISWLNCWADFPEPLLGKHLSSSQRRANVLRVVWVGMV